MSKQLAVSASLSVLMMALYVLFGAEAAREPFGAGASASPVEISEAALPALSWTPELR